MRNPIDRAARRLFRGAHDRTPAQLSRRPPLRPPRLRSTSIGVLPTPVEVRAFVADTRPDKRARLVARLLADNRRYAEHWLTFLERPAAQRLPRHRLHRRRPRADHAPGSTRRSPTTCRTTIRRRAGEPGPGDSEGFTKGIVWRGVVNASQTPQMQAAQNISQVFMGVNLKCASCHDSFINDWQLADAYGLAAIYADGPLEMVECDRPTGKTAPMKFLYAELGTIDRATRRAASGSQQLAHVLTGPKNGRLSAHDRQSPLGTVHGPRPRRAR